MTHDQYIASGCEYPGDDAPPDDESDDEMSDEEETQLYASALNALGELNETRLAGLQNAIDLELRKRFEHHTRAATAAKNALERRPTRAPRSDKGQKRAPKAEAAA